MKNGFFILFCGSSTQIVLMISNIAYGRYNAWYYYPHKTIIYVQNIFCMFLVTFLCYLLYSTLMYCEVNVHDHSNFPNQNIICYNSEINRMHGMYVYNKFVKNCMHYFASICFSFSKYIEKDPPIVWFVLLRMGALWNRLHATVVIFLLLHIIFLII